MQIVIDIPDSLYENILICWENIHPKVWKILKNGRPLPKGHGRLADLDEALKCVEETETEMVGGKMDDRERKTDSEGQQDEEGRSSGTEV